MWIMNPRIDKERQDYLVDYINKTHANHIFVWKEEDEMPKPVMNFKVKSSGLNKDCAIQIQAMMKNLKELLKDEYHVVVTPCGKDSQGAVEVSSSIGYNAINITLNNINDIDSLLGVLKRYHQEVAGNDN